MQWSASSEILSVRKGFAFCRVQDHSHKLYILYRWQDCFSMLMNNPSTSKVVWKTDTLDSALALDCLSLTSHPGKETLELLAFSGMLPLLPFTLWMLMELQTAETVNWYWDWFTKNLRNFLWLWCIDTWKQTSFKTRAVYQSPGAGWG